jgi:hypothetical protein
MNLSCASDYYAPPQVAHSARVRIPNRSAGARSDGSRAPHAGFDVDWSDVWLGPGRSFPGLGLTSPRLGPLRGWCSPLRSSTAAMRSPRQEASQQAPLHVLAALVSGLSARAELLVAQQLTRWSKTATTVLPAAGDAPCCAPPGAPCDPACSEHLTPSCLLRLVRSLPGCGGRGFHVDRTAD